jgi:hypothetical protein
VAEEVHCTKESQGHGGAAEAVGKKFVTRQSRYKKIAALDLPQEFPEGWNGTCTNDMFDIAADARKKAGYHRPGKGKICTAMICRLTTRASPPPPFFLLSQIKGGGSATLLCAEIVDMTTHPGVRAVL